MGGLGSSVDAYRAEGDTGAEVDVDLGGKDGGTSDYYASPGEDSPPLPGDDVILVALDDDDDESSETLAAVGYSDPTDRVAAGGEKRTYARDSSGEVTAEIHMRGDGSVTIQRSAGSAIIIGSDGAVTIDAGSGTITIDVAGAIKLSGLTVSLDTGDPLGIFLRTLHSAVAAWVPVPQDGGAALKTALSPWIAQTPPGP